MFGGDWIFARKREVIQDKLIFSPLHGILTITRFEQVVLEKISLHN